MLSRELRGAYRQFADGGSGRILFQYGLAFSNADLRSGMHGDSYNVLLFRQWCSDAKNGILCWLWVAKQLGVVKDIRV